MIKIGNGRIPLRIGNLINTYVYGGRYREIPSDMFGVKMAAEIQFDHDVSVPTEDFNVPAVSDLQAGVVQGLMAMINGQDVYVGCAGGIGRTGLYLAALAKVQVEYRKSKHRAGRGEDPILYVRKHFIPHAVETKEQEQYIADFDVSNIVSWLDVTQTAMGLGGLTPARNVPVQAANAWIPEEVVLVTNENTGPIKPIYEYYEEIPPDFLVGNVQLEHETHRADWKNRQSENAGLAELVDRDLDYIDNVDADSAADVEDAEAPTWEQFDSLQNQIDELEDRIDAAEIRTTTALRITTTVLEALKKSVNSLTKPTLFDKIRGAFSK